MPFSSLALVELQLVMRCCVLGDLLSLARCNRGTLHAARSDFAWGALSPLHFDSTQLLPAPQLAARLSSSLLRFADVHLRWLTPEGRQHGRRGGNILAPRPCDTELHELTQMPRLRGLDCLERRDLAWSDWLQLAHEPALAQLTDLRADAIPHGTELERLLDLFADRFPQLRALTLRTELTDGSHAVLQTALPRIAHLTELRLMNRVRVPLQSGPLPELGPCPSLLSLHLEHLHGSLWFPLLHSPSLRNLQSLTLKDLSLRGPPPADLTAAFDNLPSLTSMSLWHVKGVRAVFRALAGRLPLLCRFLLRVDELDARPPDGDNDDPNSELLPLSALATLLSSRPSLRDLTLVFPDFSRFMWSARGPRSRAEGVAAYQALCRAYQTGLVDLFPERAVLLIKENRSQRFVPAGVGGILAPVKLTPYACFERETKVLNGSTRMGDREARKSPDV